MLPRELEALWLRLAVMRKNGLLSDWRQELLVVDIGSSLGWLTVRRGVFPCLRPKEKFAVLARGAIYLANGPLWLAVQGVQPREANAFQLYHEEDAPLKDLAGQAFTANICCAFLIGALCVT